MSPELQKSTETFWHATFRDPIATFTFFLFAATIVLAISTVMLWWTTRRLAIDTKESGEGQADRMERSIGEAGRSALAMESVAKSMELNATKIVESVAMQAKFGETQLRSYLAILIGVGVYQDEKLRFEVRPKILNTGFTPARNVMWRIGIAVLPDPILKTTRFSKNDDGRTGRSDRAPQRVYYVRRTRLQATR